VRKSYLQYLIDRISDDPSSAQLVFGFYDGFGKLTLDPNDRNQVRLSGNFANSRADQHRRLANLGTNSFLYADRKTRISEAAWRWIPSSKVVLNSTLSYTTSFANNLNRNNEVLFRSDEHQWTARQEGSFEAIPGNRIEAGYDVRRLENATLRRRF